MRGASSPVASSWLSTALATLAASVALPAPAASMALKIADAILLSSYKTTRPSRLTMLLIMILLVSGASGPCAKC